MSGQAASGGASSTVLDIVSLTQILQNAGDWAVEIYKKPNNCSKHFTWFYKAKKHQVIP